MVGASPCKNREQGGVWEAEVLPATQVQPCIPPVPSRAAITPFKGNTAPGKSALQIVSILCSPWFCLCLCLVDIVTLQLVKICLLSQPPPPAPSLNQWFCGTGTGSAVSVQILLQDWGWEPILMVSSYKGAGNAKSQGSADIQRLNIPGVRSEGPRWDKEQDAETASTWLAPPHITIAEMFTNNK